MTRTWINRLFGLLLAGGFACLVYPFIVGGSNMRSFCEAIVVGDTKETVLALAIENGYSERELDNGRILIIDSRAMGRYICDVSIADGMVFGVTYIFND